MKKTCIIIVHMSSFLSQVEIADQVKMKNSNVKRQIKWPHFMCHVLFPHFSPNVKKLYMNVCKSFVPFSKKSITCENVQLTHDVITFSHGKILVHMWSLVQMWNSHEEKKNYVSLCVLFPHLEKFWSTCVNVNHTGINVFTY